jgi:hypothetical protein
LPVSDWAVTICGMARTRASEPAVTGEIIPDVPEPDAVAPLCVRLYGVERDEATGCFVDRYYDVAADLAAVALVKIGDARHMPGVLHEIEKDVRGRS